MFRKSTISKVGWALGGLPVIVSALQAGTVIGSGSRNLFWIPILGGFIESIAESDLIYAAAVQFYTQQSLILGLFLLIAIAWVTQGVLMFTRYGRQQPFARSGTTGAVALTAVLYLFLFAGVYTPIFGDVPVWQAGIFFLTPVAATGFLASSYRVFPWEVERRARAKQQLEETRQQVKAAQRSVEQTADKLGLQKLDSLGSDITVDTTRSDEFEDQCEDLLSKVTRAETAADDEDVADLEAKAEELSAQADLLDSDAVIDDLETDLQHALTDIVHQRFGNLEESFESPYGSRYHISNLPQEYRVIQFNGIDGKVALSTVEQNTVDQQLSTLIETRDVSISEGISAIETVDTHIEEKVIPYLESNEDEFQQKRSQILDDLDRVRGRVDSIRDGVGERSAPYTGKALERLLIEGTRDVDAISVANTEDTLEEAKEVFHECQFEDAFEKISTAQRDTEQLLETLNYLRGVLIPGLEDQESSIRIPTPGEENGSLLKSIFTEIQEPLRNDYGAEISISYDDLEVLVDYHEIDEVDKEVQLQSGGEIRDEVKYLVREIQRRAPSDDVPTEATVSLEELPGSILEREPVPEFVDFIQNVDGVELTQRPEPDEENETISYATPGYVSVATTDGSRIESSAEGLLDEYKTWATTEK